MRKQSDVNTSTEISKTENKLANDVEYTVAVDLSVDETTGSLCVVHPDSDFGIRAHMRSLGIKDISFWRDFIGSLSKATAKADGAIDIDNLNAALSFIRAIKPRNELEATMGSQMALVHLAALRFSRHLQYAPNIEQRDSAERAYTKLNRTFSNQVDTLKRYRTGGEQKVTVQHVNVNDGGRAIVGDVTQTSRPEMQRDEADAEPVILEATVVRQEPKDRSRK